MLRAWRSEVEPVEDQGHEAPRGPSASDAPVVRLEAADLVALLAQERRLGETAPAEALERWLSEAREAFDFRFRKAHRGRWGGGAVRRRTTGASTA